MQFGDVLKKLRKEKGMTQRELANEMRISHSSIGLYEQNRREPEYELLCKFADFFNTDIDYLLGRTLKNKKENNDFRNVKDALSYVLKSKAVQKYADYDISKLRDEELNDFAHDFSQLLKMLAHKYKR